MHESSPHLTLACIRASLTISRCGGLSFMGAGATKGTATLMPVRVAKPADIYQIKVTLRDSRPPIWRRIQVRSNITLAKFHRILQCVMGWQDVHLHQFVVQGQRYGLPEEQDIGSQETKDERNYKLSELVTGEGGALDYKYDFGDWWQHVLVVEKTLPAEKSVRYPLCFAGARACPPEHVGGTPGYEEFLAAIKDPKHPRHEEYLEWIGGEFDSEQFDRACPRFS